jgi:hypothetical protein
LIIPASRTVGFEFGFSFTKLLHRTLVANGTSVWTGRAVQAGSDDLEMIGLAHLYSAL